LFNFDETFVMSDTEVKALKKEIKKYVNTADERLLRLMYTMLETDSQKDWWTTLPKKVKNNIDIATSQVMKGQVISQSEFLKQNKKWLKK
jgi:uncharacterized protein HemY